MAQDKNKKQEESDVEKAQLEKRIDQMMDPTAPEPVELPPALQPKQDAPPAIDIFKDAKTAPKVSPELLKEIGVDDKKTEVETAELPEEKIDVAVDAPEEKVQVKIDPPKEEKSEEYQDEIPEEPELTDDDPLDDSVIDEAVDEIAAEESDKLLETEDSEKNAEPSVVVKPKKKLSLRKLLKSWKFWLLILLLIVALLAFPWTRYRIVGRIYKPEVALQIFDQETQKPVSNADVILHGVKSKTDGNGLAKLKVRPGESELTVTKKYYKTYKDERFVSLKRGQKFSIKMMATGRQVPIKITDSITGEPVKDAEIKLLATTAKTDNNGEATVVIPVSNGAKEAELTAPEYNNKKVSLVVTENKDPKNTFTITRTGKIYFLSNLGGTIDVVKSDLDGANRQVVVQGTGKEDQRNTVLLASRDWRYLVLKARRDTAQASLYLLDTKTDKLTRFDTGVGDFELIGWYEHSFIYSVTRPTTSLWQTGRQSLKTFSAEKGELGQIDQTQAEGSATSYLNQTFGNFYILDNLITYTVTWSATNADFGAKKSSIRSASPSGQNKKDHQSFESSKLAYFQASLYEPQEVYYAAYDNNFKPSFYQFADGKITTASGINQDDFNKTYPTYLISPNSKQAFWSDFRDGKNTLFLGSAKDLSGKSQIATLSDYAPYGWFTDNYLLVSKNNSELYISTANNISANKQPLKITDYYKPAQTFNGYGYGYGGL